MVLARSYPRRVRCAWASRRHRLPSLGDDTTPVNAVTLAAMPTRCLQPLPPEKTVVVGHSMVAFAIGARRKKRFKAQWRG